MTDKSYIGAGKLYMDGRHVGNVSALTLSFEPDSKELQDYTQGGGGVYNSLERVKSAKFSFTFHDYNADNLAMVVFGSSSAVTAATVADETVVCPSDIADGDRLVTTDYMIDTSATTYPVVVADTAGTAGTPFATTDYTATPAGIIFLSTGTITAGETVYVDYTKKAVNVVEALVNSATQYEMVFDGLNDAQSGDQVVVHIYKGKPGPTDGLDMIGDDFAANTVTGTIVKDTTKSSPNSQYFKIALV